MAKNLQATDLIGKTITVVNNEKIKYVVKSAEGDKLMTDFCVDGRDPMACPVPMSQVQSMIEAGTWRIEDEEPTTTATATEEVEEVQDVQPQPAKTVTMKPEPKSETPKAETAKLTYETYQNKKGKTCARIKGFSETDPAYEAAAELHASASYERDKKGNKTFYLCFGPRYATAAKDVCDLLNEGKPLADCHIVIDDATEERAKQREEWKQKREERKAQADAKPETKTEKLYAESEVRKAFATLADASGVDVKEFEPIIKAMKVAA